MRWFERNLLGGVRFAGRGRLAAASVIDAIGSGMLMPLTVLYFTVHVGFSTTSVGLGLTIGGVAALAFAPVGGVLIDALGPKPVLLRRSSLRCCCSAPSRCGRSSCSSSARAAC